MTEIVIPVGGTDVGAGLAGLEAVHSWDDLIVLNEPALPRVKLDKISGLFGTPDFVAQQDPMMGRIGELPRFSVKRGRTISYEGRVMGRSRVELRQLLTLMGLAFARTDERKMTVTTNPALGGDAYTFEGRVLDYQSIESQDVGPHGPTLGWQRPFTLAIRCADPRYYALDANNETVPRGPSGHNCPNVGTAPTDPVVVLVGPYDAATLTNATVQGTLHFTTPITAGQFLVVDFKHRTITDEDGNDARSHLDLVGSTWWDAGIDGLTPGDNSCFLTIPSGSTSSTEAVFNYRAAYWG